MLQYVSNNAIKDLKGIRITDRTGIVNCYINDSYKHMHYVNNNKDFFLINNMDMLGGDDWHSPSDVLMIGNQLCCESFDFASGPITSLFNIYVRIDSASYNDRISQPYGVVFYRHHIQYDVTMRVNGYGQIINFSPKTSVNSRIAGGVNGETVSKTLQKLQVSETYRNNIVYDWDTTRRISEKPDLRPTDFALQVGGRWISLDRIGGSWAAGLNNNGGYYTFGLDAYSPKWGVEVDS